MRLPENPKYLQEMVKKALKAKAPKMYQELLGSGQLRKFAKLRAKGMLEQYQGELSKAMDQNARSHKKDFLEGVQSLMRAQSLATERALANWLEFSDEPEDDDK